MKMMVAFIERSDHLSESNSVYLAVNGQAADKNLDSTEQSCNHGLRP
jgi:hypothetical protein